MAVTKVVEAVKDKLATPEAMERRNASLMNAIRKVHGLVGTDDLEKNRQSQSSIGSLLAPSKEFTVADVAIKTVHGEAVRVNRARCKQRMILYCHGGGYSTGSCVYGRSISTKLAMSASMDVLCFDYRLAPENPYPAQIDDAETVWDYIMLLGFGAQEVIVVGDSAGGNLALELTLRLKEEGRRLPGGLVLFSPWTDLTASGESRATKADIDPILNNEYVDRMAAAYAPGRDEEAMKDPHVSPLYADFTGFPKTYIQCGSNEILMDDSVRLASRLREANVPASIDIYEGMWHVFQMSPFPKAAEAMDRAAAAIYEMCR